MEGIEEKYLSTELIKSKVRVSDHGEVFTPSWLIEAMLDLTEESDRVDARFLEPACGTGNFLIHILQRKLAIVELRSKNSSFNKNLFSLVAIMSLYGIELLEDNIIECRKQLLNIFSNYLKIDKTNTFYKAAHSILNMNLVHGDALKMRTSLDKPIIFTEWDYLGKKTFRRRDFRFDLLLQTTSDLRDTILPVNVIERLTVGEIASLRHNDPRIMV